MPVFQYRAIGGNGSISEGEIEAGGRQDAFRLMEGQGLRPLKLTERNGGAASAKKAPKEKAATKDAPADGKSAGGAAASFNLSLGTPKITARMLENFTRLLSSLLAAGVPLSRAMVLLCKEASVPIAAAKWKELHDRVVDGMSLASAMAQSPDTFPGCGARADCRLSGAGKGNEGQGDDGDVVSRNPVLSGNRGLDFSAGVFHPAVYGDFCRLWREAAADHADHCRG
jgi:hypothetical protein